MNDLCQRYQEAYGEAGLPEILAEHGRQCADCQAFVKAQDSLRRALPVWQAPSAPDGFSVDVMARIAEANHKPRRLGDWVRDFFNLRITIPLPAAACVAALLMISLPMNVALWNQPGQPMQGSIKIADSGLASSSGGSSYTNGAGVQAVKFDPGLVGPNVFLPPSVMAGGGAGAFLLVPVVNPASLGLIQGLESQTSVEREPSGDDEI